MTIFRHYSGRLREDCHFPLLKAASKGDIDALLPILYYACADRTVGQIYSKAELLGPQPLRTLLLGKSVIGQNINRLVAALPGKLLRESRADVCNSKDNCLKNGLPQVNGLDEFVNVANPMRIEGSLVVERCLCRTLSKMQCQDAGQNWRS